MAKIGQIQGGSKRDEQAVVSLRGQPQIMATRGELRTRSNSNFLSCGVS